MLYWQTIDQNLFEGHPHAGSTATIHRAALGSFKISIDGRIAVRARRVG